MSRWAMLLPQKRLLPLGNDDDDRHHRRQRSIGTQHPIRRWPMRVYCGGDALAGSCLSDRMAWAIPAQSGSSVMWLHDQRVAPSIRALPSPIAPSTWLHVTDCDVHADPLEMATK